MIPWPHQVKADLMLRENYRAGFRAPILVAATGSGKTFIGCDFMRKAASKGKRMIFTCHRDELLTQTSAKLDEFGVHHGILSPRYKQTSDAVQVVSIQTLVRRMDRILWRPDILICDEAHLSASASFKRMFEKWPEAYRMGLTATPYRLDKKGLGIHSGGHFDSLVEPITMQELIDAGYLVKPVVYAPSTPDLSGVRTTMGDYDHKQTERLMDKKELVGDVIAHWLKLARGRPTMAFCVSIAHAEHVAERFRAAGIRAKAVSGETPHAERMDAIKALGDGRLDVVTNCALYIEGLDQPCISCIILLSPTQSLTRYLQSVGRGMRKFTGKHDCIILDHAGCCLEHGLPQQKREWSLDGQRKGKREQGEVIQRMRMCQSCFAMNPLHLSKCEQCGTVFDIGREPIKEVAGELVQVDAEALKRQQRREVGSAQTREQLEALAAARGYKRGWVDYILKARAAKNYNGPVGPQYTIRQMKGETA